MEWMLLLAGSAAALLIGHGMVVLVYAHGPQAAVRRRIERYVAGGE